MRWFVLLMYTAAVISLAGCATGSTALNDPAKIVSLRPGVTTTDEVRASLGEPDEMLANSRGEATWTYNAVNRNVIGTLVAGTGNASGSYLGGVHGGSVVSRLGPTAGALGSVVGGVVGGNIGSAVDEKVHDQFKDQHRSLTLSFERGVLREYTTYTARK